MSVQKVSAVVLGFGLAAVIAAAADSLMLAGLLLFAAYATFFIKAPNAEWDR